MSHYTATILEVILELLETRSLVKVYGDRKVVDDVNIKVQRGQIVGLLGPNGAGKTTTFNIIVGLIKPTAGSVFIDNEDISQLPIHIRARKGISYLPQDVSIFRKLTVEENILAIGEAIGLDVDAREKKLQRLLEELNLEHLAKNKAYTLSGGERRRVEIARALVPSPTFILLDEPFSGVDPIAVSELQTHIAHLKSKDLGILITDHTVREILQVTDWAFLLFDGKVEVEGTAEKIINDKKARQSYLGEKFTM